MFKRNEVPHCLIQRLVLSEMRSWEEKGRSKTWIKLDKFFKTICELEYFSTMKIYQVKSNSSASLKAPFFLSIRTLRQHIYTKVFSINHKTLDNCYKELYEYIYNYIAYISKMYCPFDSKCKITERIIRSFYYFRWPTSLKKVTGAIYQQISSFLKD